MVLNDFMHELEKCPHSLTWALCHPPHSEREIEERSWLSQVISVAREHNETIPVRQAGGGLRILPTFHADSRKFLIAGWNTLQELKVHRFGKAAVPNYTKIPGGLEKLELESKDVKTVTLILPDWWRD